MVLVDEDHWTRELPARPLPRSLAADRSMSPVSPSLTGSSRLRRRSNVSTLNKRVKPTAVDGICIDTAYGALIDL
jgi:hypothetical protein